MPGLRARHVFLNKKVETRFLTINVINKFWENNFAFFQMNFSSLLQGVTPIWNKLV